MSNTYDFGHADLLRDAAGEIDRYDALIADMNDAKKHIFASVRNALSPAEFKAWREAVKLRQKRRNNKDEAEAHDARVWAMLSMLEANSPKTGEKTSPDPVSAPAKGILDEKPPTRARAHPHDAREDAEINPATGEIMDCSQAHPALRPVDEAAGSDSNPLPAAFDEMPEMPGFLVRKRMKIEAP